MSNVSIVVRASVVKNLGSTLMRFKVIQRREQLDNLNPKKYSGKLFFSLYECKEFVERCIENGWIK